MAVAEQGWQCPLCMTVWAPSVKSCDCGKGGFGGVPAPRVGGGGWPGQPIVTPVAGGGTITVTSPGSGQMIQ
jgi:hypothetical protein